MFLFAVVIAHRKLHSTEGVCLYSVAGNGYALVHDEVVVGVEGTEYKIHLPASGKVVADAEFQAVVLLRAQGLGYVAQSVVAAVGSALSHADGAYGQTEVVGNDEQPFERYLFLLHPIADGKAGEVHVGGRLEEDKFLVLYPHVGDETVSSVLKNDIGRPCEGVQYSESDIVAGAIVFGSDVTQPYNQVLHPYYSCCDLAAADMALRVIFT